jgi:hypothetical protein
MVWKELWPVKALRRRQRRRAARAELSEFADAAPTAFLAREE